jgi:hypothetical protein
MPYFSMADYECSFRNNLVPARNAAPKYNNDTERNLLRSAPCKETKPC